MKKAISTALILFMLVPLMTVFNISAASGSCGNDLTWSLSNGTLTISGNGDMTNYSYFEKAPWYDSRSTIKNILIEDGVTTIGNYAFYQCTSLTSIEFPSSGLVSIGDEAIRECSSLTDLTLPEGLQTIGLIAIAYNPNLESVYIPDSVIRIRNMAFAQCTALKKIDYPASVSEVEGYIFSGCTALESVSLPQGITKIGLGAFEVCEKLTTINIPDTVTYIRSSAFAYCKALKTITLPQSITKMDTDVFNNCSSISVECYEGSYAESYCISNSIAYTNIISEPIASVNGYDVSFTMADQISYIRYALGEYTTASEIKNAEGCVTLNADKIAEYTENDICIITMPDGGVYSLWIKLTDGSEYIYKADLSIMQQEVVSDGVTMTVKNLYGVKDYFIAKGVYDNYTDLRANAIVQITKNKIGTKHDYTYILSEPGTYTVCIRYEDTAREHEFITVELTVTEPTFTENGLQLVVGNLEGIKVIRTAYGKYSTPGQIKKAAGARAFTGKTVLKGLSEYAIQYRNDGLVTVAVVYNNGYEIMYTYNVTKKTPEMTQNGKIVTFTGLEDLKVIRYAEGEYTTSNQIKNAPGAKYIQPANVINNKASILLDPGTYTFCVQYNDESYNYYIVDIE